MQLRVPKALLEDARQMLGREWQDLIFASRGPDKYSRASISKQREYDGDVVLPVPICGISGDQCERLDNASQIQAMRLRDGTRARQHGINSETRLASIEAPCIRGAAVIEVTT